MTRNLRWTHESLWRREWRLVEEGHDVLRLRQKGMLGTDADLDMLGERWRVQAAGWLRPVVGVLDASERTRASMRLGWRGQGEPELADGRRFSWDAESWLGTRWSLKDASGRRVFLVDAGASWGFEGAVTVEDGHGLDEGDLLALMALTWNTLLTTLQAATYVPV